MNKNNFFKKNSLFFTVAGIVIPLEVLLFLFYGGGLTMINEAWRKLPNNYSPSGIILFEGDNCSQCEKVDKFIIDNKVEDKVSFTRLEVFNNMHNADILADKSQTCGLDPSQIGVPFLWDGSNCIIGYVDVISFFKKEIEKKP